MQYTLDCTLACILDIHWYILHYTLNCMLECALDCTQDVHWTALWTAHCTVHWDVHQMWPRCVQTYSRCTSECSRCVPYVLQMCLDVFQIWSRYIPDMHLTLRCVPDVFQMSRMRLVHSPHFIYCWKNALWIWGCKVTITLRPEHRNRVLSLFIFDLESLYTGWRQFLADLKGTSGFRNLKRCEEM